MPNWIEGTMKLKGDFEDIKRFIKEGIEPHAIINMQDGEIIEAKSKEPFINIDIDNDNYFYAEFTNDPYIKDSMRAFVQEGYVEFSRGDIACINIRQAWSWVASNSEKRWKDLATKYNLTIKLFGVEKGAEFVEEVIVYPNTEKWIHNTIEYEDWDWECPFPKMGG